MFLWFSFFKKKMNWLNLNNPCKTINSWKLSKSEWKIGKMNHDENAALKRTHKSKYSSQKVCFVISSWESANFFNYQSIIMSLKKLIEESNCCDSIISSIICFSLSLISCQWCDNIMFSDKQIKKVIFSSGTISTKNVDSTKNVIFNHYFNEIGKIKNCTG